MQRVSRAVLARRASVSRRGAGLARPGSTALEQDSNSAHFLLGLYSSSLILSFVDCSGRPGRVECVHEVMIASERDARLVRELWWAMRL